MAPAQYLQSETVQEVFQIFGINTSSAQLIRSNTNLVYDCGREIIRLTPASVRSKMAVQSELAWLEFLDQQGVNVVKLISGVEPILLKIDGKTFWSVVFEKIAGRKLTKADWTPTHFQKLGRLAGQLHQLVGLYQWKPPIRYSHWDEIPEFHYYPKLAGTIEDGVSLYQKVVGKIDQLGKTSEQYGLIHYDIHQGNYLLSQDGQLVLFDFELACRSWYVHDVAIILYYAEHHPEAKKETDFADYFLRYFWKGYEPFNQLQEEEKEMIPFFLLYRDLMVFAYLLHIWEGKILTRQQITYKDRIETSIQERRTICKM